MILEESGISRATFYRHFHDKYDLMNYVYSSFFESLKFDKDNGNWKDLILEVLVFIKERKDFFTHIQKVKGQNSFGDFLLKYSFDHTSKTYLTRVGKSELSFEEEAAILYVCAGSNMIMEKWLEDGLVQTPQEIAKIMYECIPVMIKDYY